MLQERSAAFKQAHNIPFRHALIPSVSISLTSTGPLMVSSSSASTQASPTMSAFKGFTPPAPINQVSFPATSEFASAPMPVKAAIGTVKLRDESYMNGARMNMLRMEGNVVAIVASASRFEEM